jgi:hypothetical protein
MAQIIHEARSSNWLCVCSGGRSSSLELAPRKLETSSEGRRKDWKRHQPVSNRGLGTIHAVSLRPCAHRSAVGLSCTALSKRASVSVRRGAGRPSDIAWTWPKMLIGDKSGLIPWSNIASIQAKNVSPWWPSTDWQVWVGVKHGSFRYLPKVKNIKEVILVITNGSAGTVAPTLKTSARSQPAGGGSHYEEGRCLAWLRRGRPKNPKL